MGGEFGDGYVYICHGGMGVKNGWLDEATYKEPAKRAWVGLSSHIDGKGECDGCVHRDGEGVYDGILSGGGRRRRGDFHGQAGYVWAAWAMQRGERIESLNH